MRTPEAVRALALAAALLAGVAFAAPTLAPDETVIRATVPAGPGIFNSAKQIDVTVFKPKGEGPFPIAVISHGSPRSAAERRRGGRVRFEAQSRAFMAMGYAVVVPTRRGYGDSEGDWAEGYGTCSAPDYYAAGLESARDILAATDAARAIPGLDGKRIVLVGQSAGAFGSVAAATKPVPGLMAVVNFAGGRGSQGAHDVCGEGYLVDTMARYGKGSQVPQLWIYSANDLYFDPPLARRMHAAFVGAGGKAQLVETPAWGTDGHMYFRNVADWTPRVKAFLETLPSASR